MPSLAGGCLIVVLVLFIYGAMGFFPYIAFATWSFLDDFEDWADQLYDVVSDSNTNCENESDLYNFIDDIEAFYYVVYAFAGITTYFFMAICCTCCSQQFDDYKDSCALLTKPACLCLNFLLENGIIVTYIYYYFVLTDMLSEIKSDPVMCGISNISLLEESETYLDDFKSFPLEYTLYVYIGQVISFCCVGFAMKSILDGDNFQDNKPQIVDNSSVAVSSYRNNYAGSSNTYQPSRPAYNRPTTQATNTSTSRAVVPARSRPNYNNSSETTMSSIVTARSGTNNNRDRTESETRAAVLVSGLAITLYGFEFATQENCDKAMRKLYSRSCSSTTALRDAIALGIGRMLKLKDHLTKLDVFDHKFIHIVLTDGEDTASQLEESEFMALQYILDRAQFHRICKTYFVGVGLSREAERDLRAYSALGGDSAEFRKCDTNDIESIFDHISVSLVQRTRMAAIQTQSGTMVLGSRQTGVELGFNHFLVLFTLDISGSMSGTRWNTVKRAVKKLLDNLKSSDLFGIVLFNNETHTITGAEAE